MSEKASRPRPSIKGTQAATDRARKAALARHSKKKGQADPPWKPFQSGSASVSGDSSGLATV